MIHKMGKCIDFSSRAQMKDIGSDGISLACVDPGTGARMRHRVPKQKHPEIVPKLVPISFSFHKYHQHTAC